jgi:hypothetical protein
MKLLIKRKTILKNENDHIRNWKQNSIVLVAKAVSTNCVLLGINLRDYYLSQLRCSKWPQINCVSSSSSSFLGQLSFPGKVSPIE